MLLISSLYLVSVTCVVPCHLQVAARIIQHYWRDFISRQSLSQQTEPEEGTPEAQPQLSPPAAARLQQTEAFADMPDSRTQTRQPAKSCMHAAQSLQAPPVTDRGQEQQISTAEEPMSELLLRYRGSAPIQHQTCPSVTAAAATSVQVWPTHSKPVEDTTGASQQAETGGEASSSGRKKSLAPAARDVALTHGVATENGANASLHCSEEVVRGSSSSLDRLKQRQAGVRRPKAPPTDTQAAQTADQTTQPSQSRTMHTISSTNVLQSRQTSTTVQCVQLGNLQTARIIAHTQQQQPVIVPPAQPFVADITPGHISEAAATSHHHADRRHQQLSAEDSDAALLQLLNPAKQHHSKPGSKHAMPSCQDSATADGVRGAEEAWGENRSPNISPVKSHKSKAKHPPAANPAAVFSSAAPGSASTQRGAVSEAGQPGLAEATGNGAQKQVSQKSSEKLADIFAFLDGVEAQVWSECMFPDAWWSTSEV